MSKLIHVYEWIRDSDHSSGHKRVLTRRLRRMQNVPLWCATSAWAPSCCLDNRSSAPCRWETTRSAQGYLKLSSPRRSSRFREMSWRVGSYLLVRRSTPIGSPARWGHYNLRTNYNRLAKGPWLLRSLFGWWNRRPTPRFNGQSGNKRGAFLGHNTIATLVAFPLLSGCRRSSLDPRG